MNTSERGLKHVCPKCETKCYDLRKAVVACPRCGAQPLAAKVPKAAPYSDMGSITQASRGLTSTDSLTADRQLRDTREARGESLDRVLAARTPPNAP